MIERADVDGIAVVRMADGKVNALDLVLVRAITSTFAMAVEPDVALGQRLIDEVVPADELMPRALAAATRLAERIPADTFRLTKDQLRAEIRERLARRRPVEDPQTTALWLARVEDGHIRDYMRRVTAR